MIILMKIFIVEAITSTDKILKLFLIFENKTDAKHNVVHLMRWRSRQPDALLDVHAWPEINRIV